MSKKIKWCKLIQRKVEPLIVYEIASSRKYYPETIGIKFRPKNIKQIDGWYYLDFNERKKECYFLKKKITKDPKFLQKLLKKIHKRGQRLIASTKLINERRIKEKKDLEICFKKYDDVLRRFSSAAWIVFSVEKILSDKIKKQLEKLFPNLSKDDYNNYFLLLTTFQRKSTTILEYEALLRLSIDYKNKGWTSDVKDELKKVYNKFYWLGAVTVGWTYLAEPYTLKHYIEFVENAAKDNPKEQLKKIEDARIQNQKIYHSFIKKIKNRDLINNGKLLQEFIFLRTARGEYIVQAQVLIKEILIRIANEFNLCFNDIVYFTPEEILKALKTGRLPDFEGRKEGFKLKIIDGKPFLR